MSVLLHLLLLLLRPWWRRRPPQAHRLRLMPSHAAPAAWAQGKPARSVMAAAVWDIDSLLRRAPEGALRMLVVVVPVHEPGVF